MTARGVALVGIAVVLASGACAVRPSGAAGPWRGQVVDAETGQPVEGVVVLAVWDKISPGTIHPRREFHDVDEVVTDAEGRFVIPPRRLLTANPFVSIDGPKIEMFKGGYGRDRIRAGPGEGMSDPEWRKRMETKGLVFELPPLKTREERRKGLASPPYGVSYDRIPRFMDVIEEEAKRLGLPLLRSGQGGGQP